MVVGFTLHRIGSKLERMGRQMQKQERRRVARRIPTRGYVDNRIYYTDNRQWNHTETHNHYYVNQQGEEQHERTMGDTSYTALWREGR